MSRLTKEQILEDMKLFTEKEAYLFELLDMSTCHGITTTFLFGHSHSEVERTLGHINQRDYRNIRVNYIPYIKPQWKEDMPSCESGIYHTFVGFARTRKELLDRIESQRKEYEETIANLKNDMQDMQKKHEQELLVQWIEILKIRKEYEEKQQHSTNPFD